MKAIICTKYGSPEVLVVKEIEKPVPKDNEVLVKICASSVTAADMMMRKGHPYIGRLFLGILKPKTSITGTGFSGRVESIGKNITNFNIDDDIFGESVFGAGTNAEYICVQEDNIIFKKPANMSHSQAAPICDGPLTSMNFLKNLGKIKSGQRVLINGASGSLGTSAVQIAKHFGAHVTGVCSTSNLELVKSLGADSVIDYTKQDFTKNSESYDIIYDTIGKSSFGYCKASLTKNGVYISPVLGLTLLFQMMWTGISGTKKAKFSATGVLPIPELKGLLQELIEIIDTDKLQMIIDKEYQLKDISQAHMYVEKGHKKGNVVISI